ncbi:MAG: site-specific DNA-methyltransferase [Clostridiaceae bacterium]|nr:site-specific DNA-methyltransferase [Clostridiaceae bacterium]
MNGESLNILNDRLKKLKAQFPEIFTEELIDMEKLKATFTDNINFNNERYVLNWAGKSDAFKTLQIPTTATLKPQPKESVNFDTTENVFIEGENLEVLKVLQKSYYGKIKCIIIDPPYNTGNDSFIYPDSFKENNADYEKRFGDKDEEGYLMKEGMFRKNSKESGHYHSNWLSMMYPRLFLAKNLLRDDGVIFVHIDDNEVHNLRMIMNEIFGEENFVANFLWKKKGTTSNVEGAQVSSLTDSTLCYRRSEDTIIKPRIKEKETRSYPYKDNEGLYRTTGIEKKDSGSYKRETMKFKIIGQLRRIGKRWQIGEKTARKLENKNRFIFDGEKILLKIYDFEDKNTTSARPNLLFEHGSTDSASNTIKKLFDGKEELFDNPKPVKLIKELISFSTDNNDTILDFFAGSGTTAQAVLELNKEDGGNRKFILVQLPELCYENSEAYKAGYKTIADISKERIRRVIKKIEKEQAEAQKQKEEQLDFGDNPESKPLDLGFKAFRLAPSNFKIWRGSNINEDNLTQQLEIFTNPVHEGSIHENILYELILKAGYLLTDKIIENGELKIVNDELILIIETRDMQKAVDKALSLIQSQQSIKKVIILDILFKNNDQLKTNTVLQMRDAGVEFKTI